MTDSGNRDFDTAAGTWDDNPARVELARAIVGAILTRVPVSKDMDALDYGAGTGLVTLGLLPYLGSVAAADRSPGMLAKLDEKIERSGLVNVMTVLLDLEASPVPDLRFDLIVSSMTMHHIGNVGKLIRTFSSMLRAGGHLAIADLDLDDGEFHADPTGVKHNGLDRADVRRWFDEAGLGQADIETAHEIAREVEGKGERRFTVFLASAAKL
jgi:ubiquinone/menaquinone biosynthesis C-methylase UbiE